MKKLSFILKLFLLQVLIIGLFPSCSQEDNKLEQNTTDKYDVTINSIEKKSVSNSSFYRTTRLNDDSFNFDEKYIVDGSFTPETRNSSEDIERAYFYDKETENRVIAFSKNKTYDIEKSAIFEYFRRDNKLYVTAYDLNNDKLFDVEVDIETQLGVLTTVYGENGPQTRKINGCNAAIYAAGAPWTIGFGIVNPLAGLAAATFFWALEHAVC